MSRKPTFSVAVAWSFVLAGGKQGIMLVLTFVLAAILGPRDFGTVAMATGYLMIAEMLLELGLVPALMQRQDLRDTHLDSAFWVVLVWGLVLMAISAGSASLWADANDFPELARVIQVLSITLPIDALTLVQRTVLQRRMDFRSLAVRSNVAVIAGGAVSLTLALMGFGVWALVWQRLTIGLVSVSLLWWISTWRPQMRFDMAAARDLMGFSFGAMLARVATFATNRMDALVMGFFFGPVAVGIYQLGYRLVNAVLEITSRAILPVALAEFSRLQSRPEDLRRAVATCGRLSASLSIPVFAVLAISSPELLAFLGEKWMPAVVPTAVLCVTGMARAATITTGPLLRAVGRPYIDAAMSWAFGIPMLGSIVFVAWMVGDTDPARQATAIAASRSVLYGAVIFPVCSIVVWRVVPRAPLLRPFGPSVLASLAGVAFVFVLREFDFAPGHPSLWVGLVQTVATTLVVAGSLLMLDADLRETLLRFWQRTSTRMYPAAAAPAGADESSDV